MIFFILVFLMLTGVSSFCTKTRNSNIQGNKYDISMSDFVRPLGAYERLLSRTIPKTNSLSLSHGSVVYLNGGYSENEMLYSIQYCMSRHPLLRSYINDKNTKKPFWSYCAEPLDKLALKVLKIKNLEDGEYEDQVMSNFESVLNDAEFPNEGPLWSLTQFQAKNDNKLNRSALLFCVNHGIDDQQSITIILNDIITACKLYRQSNDPTTLLLPESIDFPPSVEVAVAPEFPQWNTLLWALYQLQNMVSGSKMIPTAVLKKLTKRPPPLEYIDPTRRKTILEYFTLSERITGKLRNICRAQEVTVTHALSAAMVCLTSNAIHGLEPTTSTSTTTSIANPVANDSYDKIRFLLSVGLRRFGSLRNGKEVTDWTGETVACAGGAIDYVLSCTSSAIKYFNSLIEKNLSHNSGNSNDNDIVLLPSSGFWSLAKNSQQSATNVMDSGFVPESVRLFDIGMKLMDVLQAVDIDAASPTTLGRGFSCGVSNVGLQDLVPTKDLKIEVDSIFYGTSQSRNGVLIELSSLTLADSGKLCGCLQFAEPIIEREHAKLLRDRLTSFIGALACSTD